MSNPTSGTATRRTMLRGLAIGGLALTAGACAAQGQSQPPATSTSATPPVAPQNLPKTPDDALKRLLAGNERLIANRVPHAQSLEQIRQHATGQAPYAQVFGCADSRVPVEVVFDEDFGDVFVTRTAGNVLSDPTTGTIEYGVVALNTPLIMVLGHQTCGAVKAAVDAAKDPAKLPTGALGNLVSALVPAARQGLERGGDVYAAALEAHIRSVVATLQANPVLAKPIAEGKLKVVGASYDLSTAKVTLY
ncbi:carbonic anhydrase [Crossiella equi]|uniref:Carbonic anhydrase n=1 Tax=Crossiella equi TaxID=130796 RepID=A0ABS5AEE0_9PSEU|nr:carbonic anhydrase [Crossiella equi]MBP2474952.1 carbonic anhydrase [Crossiella equi]